MDLLNPDLGLLVWTAIAFLLVIVLLGKFGWNPILNSLKERDKSIEESLEQANQARREMEQLTAKNEELLNQAKEERNAMLREARDAGNKLREEEKEKGRQEAARLVTEAKKVIETEKKAAMVEIKNKVGQMALEIATEVLQKELSGSDKQEAFASELVDKASLN